MPAPPVLIRPLPFSTSCGAIGEWAEVTGQHRPSEVFLLFTEDHCVVARGGWFYDNIAPAGAFGRDHPEADSVVVESSRSSAAPDDPATIAVTPLISLPVAEAPSSPWRSRAWAGAASLMQVNFPYLARG